MTTFDITAYTDRLGLLDLPAGVDGLFQWQEAQIRSIPFENIDVFLGRTPATDPSAASTKLLAERRGGWCFELNALLEAALAAHGHKVEQRLARVRMGEAAGGPRTHIALVCTLEGERWLVDAGFGGPAPLTPLRLDSDESQGAPNGTYAIHTDTFTGERVVSLKLENGDFSLYGLDEAHVTDTDIVAASFLCAAWQGSPFPSHLVINGYDGKTRIGIFDRAMTLETEGAREKSELADADALRNVLCGRLGIGIDSATVGEVWSRIAASEFAA